MANEKDLKNLNTEELEPVAGGGIYYARDGGGRYFVPNPTKQKNGKYYSKYGGRALALAREKEAGRETHVYCLDTLEEARMFAEIEGLDIAARGGDVEAQRLLGVFWNPGS